MESLERLGLKILLGFDLYGSYFRTMLYDEIHLLRAVFLAEIEDRQIGNVVQLGAYIVLCEAALALSHAVGQQQQRRRHIIHCTKQSTIEHIQFEGGEIGITPKRHPGFAYTLHLIDESGIEQPLDGDLKVFGSCTFSHRTIDEFTVFLGQMGWISTPG